MTVELDGDVNKAFPGSGGLPRNLLGPQTSVQDIVEHVARAVAQPHAPIAPVLSPIVGEMASEGRELLPFAPSCVEANLGTPAAENPLPKRLLLTRDPLGVADALAALLNDNGHDAIVGEPGDPLENIGGVIHLAPLGRGESEVEPEFKAVLEMHRLARAQAGAASGGTFVVAVPGTDEIDAALAGYVKALARERTDELVKCVELRSGDGAGAMANALFAERGSGSSPPSCMPPESPRTVRPRMRGTSPSSACLRRRSPVSGARSWPRCRIRSAPWLRFRAGRAASETPGRLRTPPRMRRCPTPLRRLPASALASGHRPWSIRPGKGRRWWRRFRRSCEPRSSRRGCRSSTAPPGSRRSSRRCAAAGPGPSCLRTLVPPAGLRTRFECRCREPSIRTSKTISSPVSRCFPLRQPSTSPRMRRRKRSAPPERRSCSAISGCVNPSASPTPPSSPSP